jgi:hypothetical protein
MKKPIKKDVDNGTVYSQMVDNLITRLLGEDQVDNTPAEFLSEDPVDWILRNFRIPETEDHHILLHPYQRKCLETALARDAQGNFKYSLILWSDIKKSIKSTIAAAVVLWRAFNTPWGSIKIIANDLKQADSRVSYYLRRAIELHPGMRQIVKITPSGYTVDFPNHCRIEAIPIDPKGEAGGNDDMVCFSELWGASNKAAQRLWTETTLSPTKFGKSFRWVETYAGFSGESPLLETLYDAGVKKGRRFDWSDDFSPRLEAFENDPARMFCLWNQTPRLSWQTPEYYQQEESVLLPMEFSRVHRNTWVISGSVFCPVEWWKACKYDIPALNADDPVIIGVDAAVSGDCFALVGVSGFDPANGEIFAVRFVRIWKPPLGGKIDFIEPEKFLKECLDRHNIIEVCYDPYQLEDMMGRMRRELMAHVYAFNQGTPRLIGDKGFRDSIQKRQVKHNGDPELEEHVLNANATVEGDHLRIIKRSESLKIDAAVATSMALARAKYYRL